MTCNTEGRSDGGISIYTPKKHQSLNCALIAADDIRLLAHTTVHCVSKYVPPLLCYKFDIREHILILLAEILPTRNVGQCPT